MIAVPQGLFPAALYTVVTQHSTEYMVTCREPSATQLIVHQNWSKDRTPPFTWWAQRGHGMHLAQGRTTARQGGEEAAEAERCVRGCGILLQVSFEPKTLALRGRSEHSLPLLLLGSRACTRHREKQRPPARKTPPALNVCLHRRLPGKLGLARTHETCCGRRTSRYRDRPGALLERSFTSFLKLSCSLYIESLSSLPQSTALHVSHASFSRARSKSEMDTPDTLLQHSVRF